jgi:hypothetical protein
MESKRWIVGRSFQSHLVVPYVLQEILERFDWIVHRSSPRMGCLYYYSTITKSNGIGSTMKEQEAARDGKESLHLALVISPFCFCLLCRWYWHHFVATVLLILNDHSMMHKLMQSIHSYPIQSQQSIRFIKPIDWQRFQVIAILKQALSLFSSFHPSSWLFKLPPFFSLPFNYCCLLCHRYWHHFVANILPFVNDHSMMRTIMQCAHRHSIKSIKNMKETTNTNNKSTPGFCYFSCVSNFMIGVGTIL